MTKSVAISVLCPTRGRPVHLRQSIESLRRLAIEPSEIEVLLRFDEDDRSLPEWVSLDESAGGICCKSIIGPRWGYKRMHDYYNQLASLAVGKLIFIWNDDTDMLTSGWDLMLRRSDDLVQFLRRDILEVADTTVFVLARKVYDAVGHISLNAHCDEWWRLICEDVPGAAVFRNDIVFTHWRLNDLTADERDRNYDVPGLHTEENVIARHRDAEVVKELLPVGRP